MKGLWGGEYYAAMKKNENIQTVLAHAPDNRRGLRMHVHALLSERSQMPKTIYCVIPLI